MRICIKILDSNIGLCNALKEEQPELSNEEIRARVLGDMSDQFRDIVGSPEELIKSCWPD